MDWKLERQKKKKKKKALWPIVFQGSFPLDAIGTWPLEQLRS